MTDSIKKSLSAACAVLMLAASPVAVLAETVGKMTAVQTQVKKTGRGVIGVGAGISLGDELRSNSTGLGMIVFKDESSAKLGPNSRLTIDEFVYSPDSSGSFGISMDRGVSRFYGGQVSKKGKMRIRTPHVILGARGGIIEVKIESGRSIGILRAGKMTCFVDGDTRVITKPGFACIADNDGLDVVKFPNALDVLDSPARIAGTSVPGERGPGIEVDAGCAAPGAHLLGVCSSSNGQFPAPGTVGRNPTGSGVIVRTGPEMSDDYGGGSCDNC